MKPINIKGEAQQFVIDVVDFVKPKKKKSKSTKKK